MTDTSLNPIESFREGMYVRFPVDLERDDYEFRDYRLGRVKAIDAPGA